MRNDLFSDCWIMDFLPEFIPMDDTLWDKAEARFTLPSMKSEGRSKLCRLILINFHGSSAFGVGIKMGRKTRAVYSLPTL